MTFNINVISQQWHQHSFLLIGNLTNDKTRVFLRHSFSFLIVIQFSLFFLFLHEAKSKRSIINSRSILHVSYSFLTLRKLFQVILRSVLKYKLHVHWKCILILSFLNWYKIVWKCNFIHSIFIFIIIYVQITSLFPTLLYISMPGV